MSEERKFEGWCVVEVMGHQVYAGYVSEQEIARAAFIRVDVPDVEDRPAFTKLLGAGSIFAITPTTEEVVMAVARRSGSRPVSIYALELAPQRVLPAPMDDGDDYDDGDPFGIDDSEEDEEDETDL